MRIVCRGALAVRIAASSAITTGRRAGRINVAVPAQDAVLPTAACVKTSGFRCLREPDECMTRMMGCRNVHDVSFGSAVVAGVDYITSVFQIGQHERAIGRRLQNRISFHIRDGHPDVGQIFVRASGAAHEGEHERIVAHDVCDS